MTIYTYTLQLLKHYNIHATDLQDCRAGVRFIKKIGCQFLF